MNHIRCLKIPLTQTALFASPWWKAKLGTDHWSKHDRKDCIAIDRVVAVVALSPNRPSIKMSSRVKGDRDVLGGGHNHPPDVGICCAAQQRAANGQPLSRVVKIGSDHKYSIHYHIKYIICQMKKSIKRQQPDFKRFIMPLQNMYVQNLKINDRMIVIIPCLPK